MWAMAVIQINLYATDYQVVHTPNGGSEDSEIISAQLMSVMSKVVKYENDSYHGDVINVPFWWLVYSWQTGPRNEPRGPQVRTPSFRALDFLRDAMNLVFTITLRSCLFGFVLYGVTCIFDLDMSVWGSFGFSIF